MPALDPALAPRALAWLGVREDAQGPDVENAPDVADAVAAWIDSLPSPLRDEDGGWGASTVMGAVMLTARLIRRRNSPAGIEAFSGDGATYVSREDPDVARLLRLGKHKPPQVG